MKQGLREVAMGGVGSGRFVLTTVVVMAVAAGCYVIAQPTDAELVSFEGMTVYGGGKKGEEGAGGEDTAPPTTKEDKDITAAKDAATGWLGVIDEGKLDEGMKQGSQYFSKTVNTKQWKESVGRFRDNYGEVQNRAVVSVSKKNRVPGAPQGEYMVIRYDTDFTRRHSVRETLIQVRETNQEGKSEWKMLRYEIR